MWFIYMLIGLYAITPSLKQFIDAAEDKDVRYLLILLCFFNCVIPLINDISQVSFGVYIPISSCYLFYYISGYAIHSEIIKINNRLSVMFIVLGILWCVIGQFIPNTIKDNGSALRYSDLFSVGMAFGIFSLAKTKCHNNTNWIDEKIVPLSLGVYVVHQLFLNILYKLIKITPEYYSIFLYGVSTFL